MIASFKKTDRQKEAIRKMAGPARNVMMYGGSRSGKTFITIYAMIIRACKEPNSRHLIIRLKFNHAKTSIWFDTLPKVLQICFPHLEYKKNNVDYFIRFPNGSELWVGGIDDKKRTEKILGKEYSTIFFNESSQIPYSSVNIAMTRLAEKNNLMKKAYFDENPPSKRHWSYSMFIKKKNPEDWSDLNPHKYDSILMNPEDNLENIDPDYISEILDELPANQRARFKEGKFDDADSPSIYYSFSREKNCRNITLDRRQPIYIGMDFNVDPMTAVVCNVTATDVYVAEEIYLKNSNTHEMAKYIQSKYGAGLRIIPDATGKALKTSSAGFSDHEILRQHGFKIESSSNPFRMDRYNAVNKLLEDRRLWIDPRCVTLIKDLEQVIFKEGTNMPDTSDKSLGHITDALGYLVYKLFGIRPMGDEFGELDRWGSQWQKI
jgi:PBSX family phage terminase large subunit